ncbi:MAG: ABC transporter permease [Turicibacter sp.]|nr:ABC transporter permease [Turicibacter sp.]
MKKLNKEIRKTITKSKGRFFSIFSLMALGVFVFVGLKVVGPNMRLTADTFFDELNLAQITIASTYGLDGSDVELIRTYPGIRELELGYFKDELINGTFQALRVFSAPENISLYEVISGEMPVSIGEIALDFLMEGEFEIGDAITLGDTSYQVVGFVRSGEFLDRSHYGHTHIGTGDLSGFGVIVPENFDSDVYMIARLTFDNLAGMSAYDPNFQPLTAAHQTGLETLLKNQPQNRLDALKIEPQQEIGQAREDLLATQRDLLATYDELSGQISQLDLAGYPAPTALQEALAEVEDGLQQIADGLSTLAENQGELDNLALPAYTVGDRKNFPGYQSYLENSENIDTLSNVFPVFLFTIAALVSLTTMTRFVEEERSQIALLKSLGYPNASIRKKFWVYGLVSASAGAALGTILGHLILPRIVFDAYAASSTLTDLRLTFSPFWTAAAFLVAILCTVGSAMWVVGGVLRERPSHLFAAKPPKAGGKIMLQRLPFIWKRLNFTSKVTARNLFRYKKRMLMTIFGIAGCTALLIMGFGIRDSISGIAARQFGEIINYDILTIQDPEADGEGLSQLLASPEIHDYKPVHVQELRRMNGTTRQTITLIVPQDVDSFGEFVDLRERVSKNPLTLDSGEVLLTEKLADMMGLNVGDSFTLQTADNEEITFVLGGIAEMYTGHFLFMSRQTYEEVFSIPFKENGNLVRFNGPVGDEILVRFMDTASVIALSQNRFVIENINSFLAGMDSVMVVLIGCAVLLAVVVIYNLTNINVSERIRELSTIKVLGFYHSEVTLYIYRETIFLSIIGIAVGIFLGQMLHRFIILTLPPDQVMFDPAILWTNYLLSALITLVTTLLLSFMVHAKLKKVDMLGALKGND